MISRRYATLITFICALLCQQNNLLNTTLLADEPSNKPSVSGTNKILSKEAYMIAAKVSIDLHKDYKSRDEFVALIYKAVLIGHPTIIAQLIDKLGLVVPDRMFTGGLAEGRLNAFPVSTALASMDASVIPGVIAKLSEEGNSKTFTSNALYVIGKITGDVNNVQQRALLNQYSNEYEQQARRLRLLVNDQVAKLLPNDLTPNPNKANAVQPSEQELERVTRLARIFELRDLIQDPKLMDKDEAKVIAAIEDLGELGAVEAASVLADKLDWERAAADAAAPDELMEAKEVEVMAADPKGLLSPQIAQAAKEALLQIGAPALPAIIEAVSQQYRQLRFRDNATMLIVQLSGGKQAARDALLKAAEEDDQKVIRLRELAASLPKNN